MKIPTSDRTVSNRQTSTGQVDTSQSSMAVNSTQNVLGIVQQWKTQEDRSKIQEAINTATRRTNDWKAQNLSRTGRDAEKLTEDYLTFSKELEDELSQGLSANAREEFSGWSFQNIERDRSSLTSYQHGEMQKVKKAAFDDGITIAEETIRTDARQWPKAMEHLSNTLELGVQSGVIREEEYETKKTELTNQMRAHVGKAYYTQDKHEFMRNIDQFGFGKPEIESYKAKYQNDLMAEEREKKSLFAEEARSIYGQKDDMKALAVANEDASHFFNGAEKLRAMGYKEWANNLEEEGKLYTKVIAFNSENKNKPLKEVIDSANAIAVPAGLDGASIELKSRNAIQKEVYQQAKLFNSDPAKYVEGFAQGSTMEDIVSSRLALQEKQGVYPTKGFKALTNEEKKNFKGAWESGDVQQKTGMVLESFRYGRHTPKVLEEVGVNSSLALAPYLGGEAGDERDVEMLVAGVAHKPELLDETAKSDYTMANKSSNFYSHLLKVQAQFPTNEELPQRIKDIDTAMTGISARKVDPEAGPSFFDEKFDVMDEGDKLVYFPKTVDDDEVTSFLDKKKATIHSSIQATDRKMALSAKMALRNAKWVNTTTGFALLDPKTGAMVPGSEVELVEIDTLRKNMLKLKMIKASGSSDSMAQADRR